MNVAICRPLFTNMGDHAIFKGTMGLLRDTGHRVACLIDAEVEREDAPPQLSTWVPRTEMSDGRSWRDRKLVLGLRAARSSIAPGKTIDGIDLAWYSGGARMGAVAQPFAVGEALQAGNYKKMTGAKLVLGGASVARGQDLLSKLYASTMYQRFIARVDYAFVRDRQSLAYLSRRIGPERVVLTRDLALCMDLGGGSRTGRDWGEGTVGIVPGAVALKDRWGGYDPALLRRALDLIGRLREAGHPVVLIPTSVSRNPLDRTWSDDTVACQALVGAYGGEIDVLATEKMGPEELVQTMRGLAGVVSIGRLHGAMFGGMAGVPTAHVARERKSEALQEAFDDVLMCWMDEWRRDPRMNDLIVRKIEEGAAVDRRALLESYRRETRELVAAGMERVGAQ